jgi:hypothetical protein
VDRRLPKILIDENLSPSLVAIAHDLGFECSHINHLGKAGQKDWELKKVIVAGDWTFVTNNSIDFRGPRDKPGSTGQYADMRLHAGLVCINAAHGLNLTLQKTLFLRILGALQKTGDFTNQLMEVDVSKTGQVEIRRRSLPADE